MPLGIVGANDQVGFWHEADYDGLTGKSTPPPGDSAGQGVQIPNSNKFKIPANSLKKLLDTLPAAGPGQGPAYQGHPQIAAWLAKPTNAAFAKTYFKPGYEGELKAALGPVGYAKLKVHAPYTHYTALTTHAQKPAPHSNKYNGPVGQLKALLDTNPSQQQVQDWVKGHPAFHTYLGPEYEQALKGDLGEVNHAKLQIHTQGGPAAPAPTQLTPGETVKKNVEKAFEGTPFKPITQEQALDPVQAPEHLKPQAEPDPSTIEHDPKNPALVKGEIKYHPDFKKWMTDQGKSTLVSVTNDDLNGYEQHLKAQQPSAPESTPASGNSPHYDALSSQVSNPKSVAGQDLEDPAFHGWFHSHTKADQATLAESWSQTHQKFQKWLKNHPQGAPAPAPADDQSEISKIQQQMGGDPWATPAKPDQDQPQPSAPPAGAKTQHPALAQAVLKVLPNFGKFDGQDINQMSDDDIKVQLESFLTHLPNHQGYSNHVPQLQKIYDQWFGDKATAPAEPKSPFQAWDPSTKDDPGFQNWFHQSTWEDEDQALTEYNKINPQGKASWAPGGQHDTKTSDDLGHLSFGDMAATVFPEAFGSPGGSKAQKFDAYSPAQQKGLLNNWIKAEQGKADGGLDKLKAYYDAHYGEQPKKHAPPQGDFSWKDESHDPWATLDDDNEPTDGYYQALVDNDADQNGGSFGAVFKNPAFKDWWSKQDEEAKSYYGGADPSEALKTFDEDTQGPVPPPPDEGNLLGDLKKAWPEMADMWAAEKWKDGDPDAAKALQLVIKGNPDQAKALQAVYDKHFGGQQAPAGGSFAEAKGTKADPGIFKHVPSGVTDTDDDGNYHFTPGFGAFLESKGLTPESYTNLPYTKGSNNLDDDNVVGLYNQWIGKNEDWQQKWIDQEKGGPSATPEANADDVAKDLVALGNGAWQPTSFGIKEHIEGASPEDIKAQLQEWLSGGGLGHDSKAAVQKVYDKYFGGAAQSSAPPAKDPKFLKWMSDQYGLTPTGVQNIINESGPGGKYQNEDYGNIQSYLEEYGDSQAIGGSGVKKPVDLKALAKEYGDLHDIGLGSFNDVHLAGDDEEKAKLALQANVENWQQTANEPGGDWAKPKAEKLQALYDKYFGDDESSLDDGAKSDYSKLVPDDMAYVPDADDITKLVDEGKINQSAANVLMNKPAGWWAEHYKNIENGASPNTIWTQLLTIKPKGVGGGAKPEPNIDDLKADWLNIFQGDSHLFGPGQEGETPEKLKAYAEKIKGQYGNGTWAGPKKEDIQAFLDKHFGSGGQQSSVPGFADSSTKGAVSFKQWLDNVYGSGGVTMDPANLAILHKSYSTAAGGMEEVPFSPYDSGKVQPPPAWDPSQFANDFKEILPNSGSSVAQGSATLEKAKTKVEQLISGNPGTPETEKLKKLHDKWFGAGLPGKGAPIGGGALDLATWKAHGGSGFQNYFNNKLKGKTAEEQKAAIQESMGTPTVNPGIVPLFQKALSALSGGALSTFKPSGPEPDDDEGVSAPFKSEDATPEDVAKFSGAKPADAADWKQFASWWGQTKLTPAQEQGIYQSWFPTKKVTPEKASGWFQKVYEFHSKPGSGDLGVEALPSWAHNSWAFGSKADKEWPVFKAWAAKAPGLPENLSIKQKLGIWNGLTESDKKQIQGNYLPKDSVDAPAVVDALQKAYPKSDFSGWAKMPQGTLKNNVEVLAKSGYKGAVQVWNSVYGGSMEEPKEDEKPPAGDPEPPQLPVTAIPEWFTGYESPNPMQAKKFSGFKHWMDSMGMGEMALTGKPPEGQSTLGGNSGTYLKNSYVKLPEYIKKEIGGMANFPWKDKEGFQDWLTNHQKPYADLEKIAPGKFSDYTFNKQPDSNYNVGYQTQVLGSAIDAETDPEKKQQLLDVYHKYYANTKQTLGQSLGAAYPVPPKEFKAKSWDEYLKTHSTVEANTAIKKLLKTEKDPEKWIQVVDAWAKYFGGLSGVGAISKTIGKNVSPGQIPNSYYLKQLYQWKKNGGPASAPVPYPPGDSEIDSPFLKAKILTGDSGVYAPFHGWTPPVITSSGGKPDPAMLGSNHEPSYTAPEKSKGKDYSALMDSIAGHGAAYGPGDKTTAASDDFQNWFEAQSSQYKHVFATQPGIALDDYKAFMQGDTSSGDVPESDNTIKKWDLTPYHNAPKAIAPDTVSMGPNAPTYKVPHHQGQPPYPGWSKNPVPGTGRPHVEWADVEDPEGQQEIPLPAGQSFTKQKQLHVLHRGFSINLDKKRLKRDNQYRPIKDANGSYEYDTDPLIEEISRIIHGSGDTNYPKNPGDLYNELAKQIGAKVKAQYVPEGELAKQTWYQSGPGKSNEKALQFAKWMQTNHPPPEQLYDLAKKWGVTKPEEYGIPPADQMPGSFTDPTLGDKLLNYGETSGYEETGHSPERYVPGLGNHWTQKKGTAQSFGSNNMGYNNLPVWVEAGWNGLGEDPNRTGTGNASTSLKAQDHSSEYEVTLAPQAPVHVNHLRVRPWMAVPAGKPDGAPNLRRMATYLFPDKSSSFREEWAEKQDGDDIDHWYNETVPWLKKNANWQNWVDNTPEGQWIEIPVTKGQRQASLNLRTIEALESQITMLSSV